MATDPGARLRQLREDTEVPAESRNQLLVRINEEQARLAAEHPAKVVTGKIPVRRFGWAHLFGGALATAAVVAALVFILRPGASPVPETAVVSTVVHDTLVVSKTDTLVRVVRLRQDASLARNNGVPGARQDAVPPAPSPSLANQNPNGQEPRPDVQNPNSGGSENDGAEATQQQDTESMSPALAEHLIKDGAAYLEQYNAMVVSLEKVHIGAGDRIRN